MRVLVVSNLYPPHHVGGYEIACASYVRHLVAQGHATEVLTTGYRRPDVPANDEPSVRRELRWYKTDTLDFAAVGARGRVSTERFNRRILLERIAAFAPDVVSWWGMGGMSLSLIEQVRRLALPAVGMVSDEWMLYGAAVDPWVRGFRRHPALGRVAEAATGVPARVSLSDAATWVFVSRYLRERVTSGGGPLARTAIGPTGIDADRLDPVPPRPWSGRLLYAGRVSHNKGVDVAVAALERLAPGTSLRVVGSSEGESDYLQSLRELAATLGDRVRFERPQPRERLSDVYGRADALVFPVRWEEPWGLVPLEAMACGVPVIATGTGGSAEYLRDGDNCLLFARDDPVALAAAVSRLAGDAELRAKLRESGLRTAARYTEAACNARFEAFTLEAARISSTSRALLAAES